MNNMYVWATKQKTRHRKFVFMMKWQEREIKEVLVKSSFLYGISMDMWGKVLRVLKVYTGK